MCSIFDCLKVAGYMGACDTEEDFQWAVRVGGCSCYFRDILEWLDSELQPHQQIAQCMEPVIKELFSSIMQIPHYTDKSIRPVEYRYRMLELLLAMLCIVHRQIRFEREECQVIELFEEDEQVTPTLQQKKFSPGGMELVWVFVDRSTPTGEMDFDHWLLFKEAIQLELLELGIPVDIQQMCFELASDSPGLYKVSCSKFENVIQLLVAMSRLPTLWEDEDICMLPWNQREDFMITTAWVWIRRPYSYAGNMLSIIYNQNDIDTSKWRLLKCGPMNSKGRYFLLQVCRSDLPLIRKADGTLRFGTDRIQLHLNKDFGTWVDLQSVEMPTITMDME